MKTHTTVIMRESILITQIPNQIATNKSSINTNMKTINYTRSIWVILLVILMNFGKAEAQKMQVASGTIGILNAKLRLQYEMGMAERTSVGMVMHYYLVNWTGPKFEAFGRLYGKKDGNREGFFLQGKIGYGNLKSLVYDDYIGLSSDEQIYYKEPKKRWSTFGGGVATGYKFAVNDHFIIETILGLQIYTPPSMDLEYSNAYYSLLPEEQAFIQAFEIGEDLGWYATTGLPLDLQIKFGYSF